MRNRIAPRELLLLFGFFFYGVCAIAIGILAWPSPVGKFMLINGLGGCGIPVVRLVFGVPRPKGRPSELGENGTAVGAKGSSKVPLAPVLGLLWLICTWSIEILVLLAKLCSGGAWPASGKCWVVTGLTVLATLYHFTLWKRHAVYDLRSPVLDNRQSWIVVGAVACYLALCAWLLMPPPL